MNKVIILFIFFVSILTVDAQEVTFLKLKQAFKYENSKNVPEFSGLCLKDGSLYSVNDKESNFLYKVSVDTLNSTFTADGTLISTGKDFEGICYYQNSFFVVEERECRLYKISNNTAIAYGARFLESLKSENIIETGEGGNSQIESIAMLSDSTFLIATERGITALANINYSGKILSKTLISPLHYNDYYLPSSLAKQYINVKDANSFSDLCIFEEKAYLLERKKKLIHVIDITKDTFVIISTLSFKNSIENCEEDHEYYGAAEGIAIDGNYIYIILDNNGNGEIERKHMCDKKRRTLFQFYNSNY
jgi:uncharacterized protein YjiK